MAKQFQRRKWVLATAFFASVLIGLGGCKGNEQGSPKATETSLAEAVSETSQASDTSKASETSQAAEVSGNSGSGTVSEAAETGPENEPEVEEGGDAAGRIEVGRTTDHTDENARKEIECREMTDFYTGFYTFTRWAGDEEQHEFEFQVQANDKGELTALENVSGVSCPADEKLLDALQVIIDKYELAALNGTNRYNYSISPEYQKCSLKAEYASGEKLEFTDLNDPYAQWEEEVYTVFAEWFRDKGDESLLPAKETSPVTRFSLTVAENGLEYDYGETNVQDSMAINGEKHLLRRSVYDLAGKQQKDRQFILIPEGYLEGVTEILAKYDPVTKYDFSTYDHLEGNFGNHDMGYFGWGDKSAKDGEEDSEELYVDLYAEFGSGKRINIETKKASEIEAMMPMLTELREYYDSLF